MVRVVVLAAAAALASCADSLTISDAPVVVAVDASGSPPALRGGAMPAKAEYVLTGVQCYNVPKPGAATGKAGTQYQERLRYSGGNWEAIFLLSGVPMRWGGTYSIAGNMLTSKVAKGARAGETLVDEYESSPTQLIVRFTAANGPLTQLTFTRR